MHISDVKPHSVSEQGQRTTFRNLYLKQYISKILKLIYLTMGDLVTSLTPIYYISKLFGQANITFTGTEKKRKVIGSRKSQIYSIICHGVITVMSIYIHDIRHEYKEKSSYRTVILLHINTSIILLMASVIFNLLNIEKQIVTFKRLLMLDKSLKKMGIFVNNRHVFSHICRLCIIQYVLFLGYYVYGWKDHYDFEEILIIICIFVRKNARFVLI